MSSSPIAVGRTLAADSVSAACLSAIRISAALTATPNGTSPAALCTAHPGQGAR